MANPNTGTSGEFFVLSVLLRKGHEAYITLGNTKSVDIVLYSGGARKTIDVKSSEYDKDFIVGNVRRSKRPAFEAALKDPNHYYVFVTYKDRIEDEKSVPDCFVVPASRLLEVCQFTSGQGPNQKNPIDPSLALNAKMKKLRASGFLHAWSEI